ncbi:hypothetical protein KY284_014327 [Solanum tuberosum]|nr:hypothetical protein KY284_014327 [Solanum tuberosum]
MLRADTNRYLIGKVVHLSALRQSSDGRNPKATAILGSGKVSLFTSNTRGTVILNYLMDSLLRGHNLNKPFYHDVVKYKEKWNGYFHNHRSYLVISSGDADLFLVDRYLEKPSEQTNYAEQHAATSDDDAKEPECNMTVRSECINLRKRSIVGRKLQA